MNRTTRTSLSNRIIYAFDKMIAKGPQVLMVWVIILTLAIVLLLALVVQLAELDPEMSLPAVIWTILLQALAPNPVDASAGPVGFLAVMLVITLVGIFMVSIFIGIITTSIETRIHALRKGRSQVIDRDHTVILGWDDHIYSILSELVIANQSRKHACIVILGERDKVEMEDDIRARLGNTGSTEIICRSGSPIEMVDLEIVNLNQARAIIILPPNGEDADTSVIKTLLAILNNPEREQRHYHIITEIRDLFNLEAARLVGKDDVTILMMRDIIAHITAQTCRQSGLSVVYTELLNFEGDEIYFKEEPALVGKTFGEALFGYPDSSVIGLEQAGKPPKLNPPMDTRIQAGDQIIAISEDDSTVVMRPAEKNAVKTVQIELKPTLPGRPERMMILGWNARAKIILNDLEQYVPAGSQVSVVANQEQAEVDILALREKLTNLTITLRSGNIADRSLLDSLELPTYRHVIVLADLDGTPAQLADARTLITLLHLRDIDDRAGHPFSIVSEMRDVRNRQLAEITHVDDFIVSDELTSLLMAQVSENHELKAVFADLFDDGGSEIYLKPVGDYICLDCQVNFYTVVEAARRKNEVAIGYRLAAHANRPERGFGVVVNPDKTRDVIFNEHDKIIVLAES